MTHWDRYHKTVLLIADGVIEGEKQDLGGWDSLDVKGFIEAIKAHLNYIYDNRVKSAKIWIRNKEGELVCDKTIRFHL